jgi:hypothetical protein
MLLTLMAPIDQAEHRYHIGKLSLYFLELTIVIPLVLVWLSAAYGSLRLKADATRIMSSSDGKALALIAQGLLVLVSGLVVTTILQSVTPLLRGTGLIPAWTVIGNILEALWPLAAFWLIYQGSQGLMRMVKTPSRWRRGWLMIALAPIVAAYAWMLLHHPYRAGSPDPGTIAAYYMPDIGLIVFLVLPYALTWYLGLVAALQVRHYRRHAPGVIYRRSLVGLVWGMVAVIGHAGSRIRRGAGAALSANCGLCFGAHHDYDGCSALSPD